MVFINGVNIGRYWSVGPQRTLYVPAPILKSGINRVRRREGEEEGGGRGRRGRRREGRRRGREEEGEGGGGKGTRREGEEERRGKEGGRVGGIHHSWYLCLSDRSSYLRCFNRRDLRLSVLWVRLFWTSRQYLVDIEYVSLHTRHAWQRCHINLH